MLDHNEFSGTNCLTVKYVTVKFNDELSMQQ